MRNNTKHRVHTDLGYIEVLKQAKSLYSDFRLSTALKNYINLQFVIIQYRKSEALKDLAWNKASRALELLSLDTSRRN